jgi:hypothetical protein
LRYPMISSTGFLSATIIESNLSFFYWFTRWLASPLAR